MEVLVASIAQAAVNAMLSEFAYRIDNGHAASVPDLCTDDLVFDSHMGSADIDVFRQHMMTRQDAAYSTRHSISNVRIANATDELIEATAIMSVMRLEPEENGGTKETAVILDCSATLVSNGSHYRFKRISLKPFSIIEHKK